jgi:hypothetical protein
MFMMVGNIKPQEGVTICTSDCSKEKLAQRVNADPFGAKKNGDGTDE